MTTHAQLGQTAIVIVDMQELSFSETLKGEANQLVAQRKTLVSQIIHLITYAQEKGWPIFFTKEEFASDFHDAPKYARLAQDPRYLAGNPANEFVTELIPYIKEGKVIVKKRHSAVDGTRLREELNAIGIEDILLAGVNTDACITAGFYGLRQDFNVHIVSDCVGSPNENRHELAIGLLKVKAPSVRLLAEIQAAEQGLLSSGPTRPSNPASFGTPKVT